MSGRARWRLEQPPGWEPETAEDFRAWRDGCRHARALERQRQRRATRPRVDYYPSEEARAVIVARLRGCVHHDQSSVINRLILAGAAIERDAT